MSIALNFMASSGFKVLLAKGESGNYKIMIIDYNTEDSYAMLSAMRKPVNIKIQANTIIQNEERQASHSTLRRTLSRASSSTVWLARSSPSKTRSS
ncbi:hypothetical protein FGO68_gene5646 [Halteria grandinella]|uniref:Uncharacterized protein n=1 Tax=Halteria grandinella TaxID=5974 RepID=A0A8J8NFU5_HALGN|nr:hypothetical protein FGO68_gene5646 [Halteria grandinella]